MGNATCLVTLKIFNSRVPDSMTMRVGEAQGDERRRAGLDR